MSTLRITVEWLQGAYHGREWPPSPDTCGSAHARCFPRPGHLARWPCRHMTLTWTTGVVGPLALGAGAGVGLGLFVPAHR